VAVRRGRSHSIDGLHPPADGPSSAIVVSPDAAIVVSADAAVAELAVPTGTPTAALLPTAAALPDDGPIDPDKTGDVTPAATFDLPDPGLVSLVTALTLGTLAFTVIQAFVLLGTGDVAIAIAAVAGLGSAAWLHLVARRLASSGRLTASVVACCAALLALTLVVGYGLPGAIPIVVAFPLLAVAIALPFSDRRTLLWVMAASWATEVAVALAALVVVQTSTLPPGILAVLRVSGLAVGAALVMALLWQFNSRLGHALAKMAAANVAIRAAEEQVGHVNDELRHRVGELEQRSREMAQLAKLGDLLQSCETSEEAYAVIAQTAGPLFAGDSGVLYELTGNRTVVEQVAAWGENSSSASVFAPSECWALRRGRAYVVEDTGTDLLCPHVGDAAPPGYLCVPLTAQSETLGMLHVEIGHKVAKARRASHLSERMRLTVTLSEHLALALANFRLRATLRERSTRDELTGLFNRRYMEDSLDREMRRGIRDGEALGVLMLDLDHFKRLNDAFGHAAGDFALRQVGQFLQANVRAEDIACRFGGEEFVVILPKASAEDTRRRAEALRLGIRSLRTEHGGPTFPTLTMSVGVAAYPQHGATGESLLRAADEALYRAKAEGRDRVVVAGLREGHAISVGQE
jgi:diguanylate cyclase (GGDEF)-like protein